MPVYDEVLTRHDNGHLDRERSGELEYIRGHARVLGGPILELACGAARVTRMLARDGFEVYGLDASVPMLALGRETTRNMDQRVRGRMHFVRADMRQFAFSRRFPLIVLPFHSFWFNLDEAGGERCLACILAVLQPNGRFLIDVFDDHLDFWRAMATKLGFRFRFEDYFIEHEPDGTPYAEGQMLVGWLA
jgi:SAM-dependent methyltransferase